VTKTASGTDRFRPLPPQAKRLHAQSSRSRDAGTVSRELFLSRNKLNAETRSPIHDTGLVFFSIFASFSTRYHTLSTSRNSSLAHEVTLREPLGAPQCSPVLKIQFARTGQQPLTRTTRTRELITVFDPRTNKLAANRASAFSLQRLWNHQRAVNRAAESARQHSARREGPACTFSRARSTAQDGRSLC